MSSNLQNQLHSQRQKNTFTKTILIALACIFLFVAASLSAFYWFIGGAFDKKNQQRNVPVSSVNSDENIDYPTNKVNILVLGVDDRQDDVGRSDTMFIITLDPTTKQASMLSVPRDTRVAIPKHGWDKINHAFAYGGLNLSKRSAENLLGIPMDYYVSIDFKAFNKVIDALGGVTINVEKRMYYEDPYDNLVINLYPGEQQLNGQKALHYVRYRDEEGDIGRIERQQKFIKALLSKAANPLIITRLPSIIREVTSAVKTDMTTSEILGLAKFLNDAASVGLRTEMVSGVPVYIDGVNYWLPDVMKLRNYVALTQGLTYDPKWLASAKEQAELYENSIPARAVFDEPFSGFGNGNSYDFSQAKTEQIPVKESKTKTKDAETTKDETAGNQKSNTGEKIANKLGLTEKKPEKENINNTDNAASKPVVKSVEPAKPAGKSSAIMVNILNASGSVDAGSKMAATMRQSGFEVTAISVSANTNSNTVVIANTSDSSVTDRLTSLPFSYALQINADSAKATQVTVIIGKDYL